MKTLASFIAFMLFFQAPFGNAEGFDELKEAFERAPKGSSQTLQRIFRAGETLNCRTWINPSKKWPEPMQTELFGKDGSDISFKLSAAYGVPKIDQYLFSLDRDGQLVSLREQPRGLGIPQIMEYFRETESSILIARLEMTALNTDLANRTVRSYAICDLPK